MDCFMGSKNSGIDFPQGLNYLKNKVTDAINMNSFRPWSCISAMPLTGKKGYIFKGILFFRTSFKRCVLVDL